MQKRVVTSPTAT